MRVVEINGPNGKEVLTEEDLDHFRKPYITNALAIRMTTAFLADLWVLSRFQGVDPKEVLSAVRQLEDGDTAPGTKQAKQFRHAPLKGLWHKHYFSARFLPMNIFNGLANGKLERITREETVERQGEPVITLDMISSIAKRTSEDVYTQRHADQKLTGEWIVFFKRAGEAHFLCLATHTSQDDDKKVFAKAQMAAFHQGPDWAAWFSDAVSTGGDITPP